MHIILNKNIIILLTALCCCLLMTGQSSYSITGKAPSGEFLGDSPVFMLNDMARFYVADSNNQMVSFTSSTWSVEGLDLKNIKRIIIESDNSDYFNFSLDTAIINTTRLKDLKQTIIDNSVNIYNSVKIICKGLTINNTIIECEKTILLNILPIKPEIKLMEFHCDDKYDDYNSAYADFMIIQSRDDEGHLLLKEYDEFGVNAIVSHPLPVSQSDYFRYYFWYPFDYKCYGTIFTISTNSFGTVFSDTFIVDNKIHEYPTKLDDIKTDRITIFPNPVKDRFTISGIMAEVQFILVTDLSGKIVKTVYFNQNPIDISDLNKGLYNILIIYKKQNRKDMVKIIKH